MKNNLTKLVTEALKTNVVRMHQNGFYQLDLINDARLHIWPDQKQERQKNYNGIHDHRFSFESFIILGCLLHTEYGPVQNPNGKYQLYAVAPKNSVSGELKPTNNFFDVLETKSLELHPGNLYEFDKGIFHQSINKREILTSTVMKKTSCDEAIQPRVIGVRNYDPDDNTFDRLQIDEDKALFYIKRVLRETNPEILAQAYQFVIN